MSPSRHTLLDKGLDVKARAVCDQLQISGPGLGRVFAPEFRNAAGLNARLTNTGFGKVVISSDDSIIPVDAINFFLRISVRGGRGC